MPFTVLGMALLPWCNSGYLMAAETLLIDDRSSGDYRSSLGPAWRLVTDRVMGGVSNGTLTLDTIGERACLRLSGEVSLDNNGGFVQAALDLEGTASADASAYQGVELEVYGNGEAYNVHLRTGQAWLPWQAYRTTFNAPAGWHKVQLPFAAFKGYRISARLQPGRLERIGIVAIGRAFSADICVAGIALYRNTSAPPDKGN